ncbi:hypothetical protein HRG_000475 [Hirsutella rhossiliensis]|uniref:F-box domain-containing protein n=1 Tax=Hirsutella rhossiliensis TaxID=111463 RepID=A0A9P8SLS9_9HYPO|nr:uncharacterized protein HRG_00475 [Hirsutella rhossiliensis]KAH0967833.1 hypothetical protein HRG_00475 [Hirsutella rhossiliensis]
MMGLVLERESPARRHDQQQAQDCPLLQLPVELILLISDHLPRPNQMVFSQTCSPLRNILHYRLSLNLHCQDPFMGLSRGALLEYLICMGRQNPNVWLCETCRRLHKVTECEIGRGRRACMSWARRAISCPGMLIYYHHVQLALKYNRIGGNDPKCRGRLQSLLAPHHHDAWYLDQPDRLSNRFSSVCKIVEGNFILMSVWECEQRDADIPVSRRSIGALSICSHQFFSYAMDSETVRATRRYNDALASAIVEALRNPDGGEVTGACHQCATDFAVEGSPQRMKLRTWRNLGPEGSPLNPEWKSQVNYMTLRRNNQPGAVRAMYEGQ